MDGIYAYTESNCKSRRACMPMKASLSDRANQTHLSEYRVKRLLLVVLDFMCCQSNQRCLEQQFSFKSMSIDTTTSSRLRESSVEINRVSPLDCERSFSLFEFLFCRFG